MVIPADFIAALDANPLARATFDKLNRANLFAIYYRLTTAKKPQTRAARLTRLVEMLARGETVH